MAGSKAASRAEAGKGAARTSSMDSAISAATKSHGHKDSQDTQSSPAEIAGLIKTAGSPEAVIQYLLKDKHSQSQQNSQLWRLVDKQRAMILGLNKDLERALKDKEKYRKKLKEVMSVPEIARAAGSQAPDRAKDRIIPKVDVSAPSGRTVVAPDSPSLDSDSQKHSPIDMAMAPYPITPPADQPHNGPPSAVGEMLDPAHTMPKSHEHAYDQYDHEAEERAQDVARKEEEARQMQELPLSLSLPPSRSLPSQPPRMPPPKPPTGPAVSGDTTPKPDENLAQFPSPPPRKAPPAPLQLHQGKELILDDDESDSDYDELLQVNETNDNVRGRRRTREEDEQVREVIAQQVAERRSLSKKSSAGASPVKNMPASPREVPGQFSNANAGPASLAGVLSGDQVTQTVLSAPKIPAGLPLSPRPQGAAPLSPRSQGLLQSPPLSPRPPRQPIPMPPGTQLTSPPPQSAVSEATSSHSSSSKKHHASGSSRVSPTERSRIFKGFVTDEYPDLLLPPNALPSIQIRVASSRMKPSRASVLALTQLEEDPVFTLAIFSRSDSGELWRVEKDLASLAKLDQKLKHCAAFNTRAPDRSLFSGHAPAKLDARRVALNRYFEEVLDTPFDSTTAMELCKYLSSCTLPPNSDSAITPDSVTESPSTKTGPGGRPYRSGYLTKRGKNFGGWKARFFMLDGPQLKYYEAPGGAHLGTIKLPHAQIGKQSHQNEAQTPAPGANGEELDNQYRHAFLVLEPKKKDSTSHVKHVLCAESDMERDQWVDALLKWIDYREPGEEEERHASSTHDRSQKKKKSSGSKGGAHHEPSGSDSLIGVSYDSTSQGHLPQQGGAARPKTSSGLPEHPDIAHNPVVISAPKDMQVISDSSSWGGRGGLTIPSMEEKKQRKRSFFGFGPKTTRSSADGQDSLFGDNGSTSSTPPQGGYQGPIRQSFGAPLAEAVRHNSPTDVRVPLPAVVYRCIQYLDAKNASFEEGIFRLSGSNVVIKQLRERFNTEGDINLVTDEAFYDIHAVASLLKLYLRELPTTILTRDLHLEFMSVTEMTNPKDKVAALNTLVQRLPLANATLLKYLIAFLIKIINNADVNKMTVRNVGIVFSPTLNIPAPVFAMFLQNYEPIFGIEPEEYELPSPSTESEASHDSHSITASMQRPGTAGQSQSPHRRRLLESVQGQRRNGGTPPPLLQDLNAARASPPQNVAMNRPMAYDTQYMAQQSGGMRPAYETNLMPQSYDNDYRGQSNYEQPYSGGSNKRRESAIFNGGMVGLNHQGSRSRLRDETRF
jgi:RalA-binding protein 1